jgi:hypothetical protein
MTKPVAAFRSGVIGDPGHIIRPDENSHLVLGAISLFQPVYRISPHGRCDMAGCRLVSMLVGSRDRVGLVTLTPNGHLAALFGGPFHVQLGGCFLSVR